MKKLILIAFLLFGYFAEAQVSRIYTVDKTIVDSKAYRKRVVADAGAIRTDNIEKAFRAMAIQNEIYENISFAWFGESGYKHRVASATASFWSKLYSSKGTNDATQTTELNQPYLSGNIAPNERWCMKNANAGTKSVTHTGVVVSGTYTVTTVEQTELTGKYVITHTELTSGTLTTITPSGRLAAKIIRSTALTTAQKLAESNFFRSIYPEIETVKIGTQDWATSNLDVVATPQGNVISNVTENVNVEKITNIADREFSSDTGWWIKNGTSTINNSGNGLFNLYSVSAYTDIIKPGLLTVGNYYKFTYTIVGNRSTGNLQTTNIPSLNLNSTVGTWTYYFKAIQSSFDLKRGGTPIDIDIDNVSVQEIGWAGSTELYDGIYAQTTGTVEQKTYAAVKAAAMWCYYNNDPALGAIYGKLYNYYAAKLLQMDIDYYNAANPTTPWGYRVPTSTDFTTLQTTLGGDAVAGGKMKKEGLNYWDTPNTGANNSSGFSALGGGLRFESTGVVQSLNLFSSMLTQTSISSTLSSLFANNYNDNFLFELSGGKDKRRGSSIRLIKN